MAYITKKFLIAVFVVSNLCVCVVNAKAVLSNDDDLTIKGYYWREFGGVVPDDALAGGTDFNGGPIYIGQVLYESKIIPAKIYQTDPKAYFYWGGEQSAITNIKILCTQRPELFEWVKVENKDIYLLTNRHLVLGGYEPSFTTYIGRMLHDGETLVGKVIVSAGENLGLFVTRNGVMANHQTFEVLTYNLHLETPGAVKK